MSSRFKPIVLALALIVGGSASPLHGQQKGQWVPGQFGLNAGVIPDPGVTYANLAVSYSADQLNGPAGNSVPGITGNYSFWADENIFYYVPNHKFLGGYFMPYVVLTYASGELVADIPGNNLSAGGGGSGFADTYVQPLNIGCHVGRKVPDTFSTWGQRTVLLRNSGRTRPTPTALASAGATRWGFARRCTTLLGVTARTQ